MSSGIIHPLLQRDLLLRHHVVVADDVVDFHFEPHVGYARAGPLNTSS
jgi:hypothetical protein